VDEVVWLQALTRHTVVLSAALLLVLALRGPARRHLGASVLRPLWATVPATLLALVLAPWAWPLTSSWWRPPLDSLQLVLPWRAMTGHAPALSAFEAAPSPTHGAAVVLAVWGMGTLVVLGGLALGQWRYLRLLVSQGTRLPARLPAGHSPAQLGLWRSRLALPRDFEQRFSPAEQALILAHEHTHHHHHDNAWQLLAALLCALHWFNPLVWWAARAWREDAELVCDAAVLQAHPQAAGDYARALLASHGPSTWQAAMAAPWWPAHRSHHPLIERVRMLNTPTTPLRRMTGLLLGWALATLSVGAAFTAQAAADGPAQAQQVELRLRVLVNGLPAGEPRLIAAPGQTATVSFAPHADAAPGDSAWQIAYRSKVLPDGKLQIDSQVRHGDPLQPWGQNSLIAAPGETRQWFVSDDKGQQVIYVYQTAQLVAPGAATAVTAAAAADAPPALPTPPTLAALPPLPPLPTPSQAPTAVPQAALPVLPTPPTPPQAPTSVPHATPSVPSVPSAPPAAPPQPGQGAQRKT
jgi:beta-lactamase regulating signal transducer with metallopeptidase domain